MSGAYSMNVSPLLGNIRTLRQGALRHGQVKAVQDELCDQFTSLIPPYETYDELITQNVLRELVTLDIARSAVILKHPAIEPFLDQVWADGLPMKADTYYYPGASRSRRLVTAGVRYFKHCAQRPRLIWVSHASRNVLFFVLLTVLVFSQDLLVQYPHPVEMAVLLTLIVPSLFPPYSVTFPGYLAIAILFLVSFIFRGVAFKHWPYVSIEGVRLLLNSRTLLSFLPLIQLFNLVLLTFRLPRLAVLRRIADPTLPIAVTLFIGFFLSLHILSDTHNTVRHTFDVLLRTVLLDVHAGSVTEFHPIAARIVYYLFAFFSLYLFWGVGIAGVGMRVVKETDWDAERVRWKALRLLKFLPEKKKVLRTRMFGRGKIRSAIPFNFVEGIGVAFRMRWLSRIAFYVGIAPTVLAWTAGRAVWKVGVLLCVWVGNTCGSLFDEVEDSACYVDGEDGVNETSRLLS